MVMQSLERIIIVISGRSLEMMISNLNIWLLAQTMDQNGVTGVNGHHVAPHVVQMLDESKLVNVSIHRELLSIGKLDTTVSRIGNLMKPPMMIAIGLRSPPLDGSYATSKNIPTRMNVQNGVLSHVGVTVPRVADWAVCPLVPGGVLVDIPVSDWPVKSL